MTASSHKGAYDLTHQQSDILDYITEIAQELAHMAARAGCDNLSHDLKQAILKAHGGGEKASGEGANSREDGAYHERL